MTTKRSSASGEVPGVAVPISRMVDGQRPVWKTSEVVAFAVVRDIVDRGLRSGDRLPLEAEMVEQYRVSRESLREALRLLEAQGIVSIRRGPNGGPVVGRAESANLGRTMTLYFQLAGATYDELLAAWRLLEPLGAELAARNPHRAAVEGELAEHLGPFEDGGVRSTYTEHSNRLHFAVTELAHNRVLTLIMGAVGDIIRTHVIVRIDPFELRQLIDDDHAAIAAAVIDGDASAARQAMADHIDRLDPIYRAHWEGNLDDPIEWK
jgi:GntR family transcriptional regulator, transcriptional repressor for pyruvate dehydrogenase complex